jgi:ABC-2 type transport system permease protein
VAGAGACVAAAYRLFARRDYGAGILAARPGPARGSRSLGHGLGLAWRLHRGAVLGWAGGMFLTGIAYGAIGNDAGDLIGDSENSRDLFTPSGADLVSGFYATSILMLALICCGFAISSTLRPRAEEENGHLEQLLATALPRERWLLGHVAVTVVGSVAILAVSGAGLGAGFFLATGERGPAWDVTWPVLQYVAPVLLLSAIGRLVFGLAPRLMVIAWVPLVLAAVVLLFGDLLQLPQWLQDLSPFEHLALVPAEDFRWTPVLVVAVIAAAVSVVGQLAFWRRDGH